MEQRKYTPIKHLTRTKSLVGQVFGKLTATECIGRHRDKTFYLCSCECGRTSEVSHSSLSQGNTASCGCSHWTDKTKHGMAATVEYTAWLAMKARCSNEKGEAYPWYGGSGIGIAPEWVSDFAAFFACVGKKPTPDHSLERMDNTKGYGPGNCRWATTVEQCNNRRNSHIATIDGVSQTLAQWARETGQSYSTIQARLRRGWSERDAIKGR